MSIDKAKLRDLLVIDINKFGNILREHHKYVLEGDNRGIHSLHFSQIDRNEARYQYANEILEKLDAGDFDEKD